jgi:putative endonuclease
MPEWHVYLVRTRQGTLYTGIATDVSRRLDEHERSGERASKYLRSRGPLELAYQTKVGSRSLALKVERCVKQLTRKQKEKIVTTTPAGAELLELLGLSELSEGPIT